jgi:NO-binding membrane sensor protein with MHYT domain
VLRTLNCLTQQHDYRLVMLALGVCALGSYGAITLLNHVRIAQDHSRWGWLAAAATASGFSIWATHFIAMLAFSPDEPTGYDLVLTLLSLVAAIAVTGLAYLLAIDAGSPMRALAGALVGGGIATMHYTGMAAFHIAGFIVWDEALVAASIAFGCGLGAAALVVGAGNATWFRRLQGALLLTFAIFSLHFTAMGAASIVRDPTITVAGSAMSPGAMAVGVAVAVLAILTLTLIGVGLDRRDRRRTAAFVRDLAAAKKAEEQQNLLVAELDHRVKNVLARVAVVAQRTRESSRSMDQFLDVFEGRIQSMANTHDLLSRFAMRLRLHGGRAGAASPAHHLDVDRTRVSGEALAELVAWRQAHPSLLHQCDAGATSRLVPRGPGAAFEPVGSRRHPPACRPTDLLR